jgi:hypothetical protein
VNNSLPGDVAIFPHDPYLGHVMIVGLDGNFIGAGEITVNVRTLDYMRSEGYSDPIFWRY